LNQAHVMVLGVDQIILVEDVVLRRGTN
jgi:hypothetical protein